MSDETSGNDNLAGFIEDEGLDPNDFMFGVGGSYGGGLTPIDLGNVFMPGSGGGTFYPSGTNRPEDVFNFLDSLGLFDRDTLTPPAGQDQEGYAPGSIGSLNLTQPAIQDYLAQNFTGSLETIQDVLNDTGRAVGTAIDWVFDVLRLPKPQYGVLHPSAGGVGGTVVWGQPSGGVFGRIGTTPGGTITGVQTGIPAVDILIGKTADVISGRVKAGDVLTPESIEDILVETGRDVLGIPDLTNPADIVKVVQAGTQNIADDTTDTGIDVGVSLEDPFEVDRGDTASPPEIDYGEDTVDEVTGTPGKQPPPVTDQPVEEVLDSIPQLEGGITEILRDSGVTIDESGDNDRVSSPTTDRAPSSTDGAGSAVGFGGPRSGVAVTTGGPGDLVDLDYVIDPYGRSIIPEELLEVMGRDKDEDDGVKRFNDGGPTAEDYFEATSGNQDPGTGAGGSGVSQYLPILGTVAGGLAGLFGDRGNQNVPIGYTGGIPEYKAERETVPGVFDATDRRPGSSGRRYFTYPDDKKSLFTPVTGDTGTQQIMGGDELAAMNEYYAEQQAEREARQQEILDALVGIRDQNLAAQPPTADGSYTPDEIQQVANAILSGQTTMADVSGTYGETIPQIAENIVTGGYGTQEQLAPLLAESILGGQTSIGDVSQQFGVSVPQIAENIVTGGYGTQEQLAPLLAESILGGQTSIGDVSQQFGVSVPQIAENMLTGGFATPEQLAGIVAPDVAYTGDPQLDLLLNMMASGETSADEVAAMYGTAANAGSPYAGITADQVQANYDQLARQYGFAQGGSVDNPNGYYLGGPTDGMADRVPATIEGSEPARLSDGEFVIPADVVSHLGNGNSDAGANVLYGMMDRVRKARTGRKEQGREIQPNKMLPV